MKEIFKFEWIWKKYKDNTPVNLTIRIPNHIKELNLPKGNYIVKIFKLESEVN